MLTPLHSNSHNYRPLPLTLSLSLTLSIRVLTRSSTYIIFLFLLFAFRLIDLPSEYLSRSRGNARWSPTIGPRSAWPGCHRDKHRDLEKNATGDHILLSRSKGASEQTRLNRIERSWCYRWLNDAKVFPESFHRFCRTSPFSRIFWSKSWAWLIESKPPERGEDSSSMYVLAVMSVFEEF